MKSAELSKLPKGQSIGIPGAPYATPVASDSSSIWTLCDTVTKPRARRPGADVGDSDAVDDRSRGRSAPAQRGIAGVLSRQKLDRHPRAGTPIDLTDRALTSAVGIPVSAKATPISEGLFNALPNAGAWQLPPIPDAGAPNTVGLPPNLVIGSVFQIHTDKGPQYYVVLPDGIAQVNGTTAAALRATASYGLVAPPSVVRASSSRSPNGFTPHPCPTIRSRSWPAGRAHAVLVVGARDPAIRRRRQRCSPAGICR